MLADEGDLLSAIDESDKHTLFVWKWNEGEEGTLIAKTPVGHSPSETTIDLQECS